MPREQESTAEETMPVETEKLTVDGKDVTIERSVDNAIEVKLPEGLDDAEKAEFIKKVETGSKLVGSYYRKLQETNERIKSLEEREKALDEREKKLTAKTSTDTGEIDPVWKRLGLRSEEDEEDFAIDNPAKYQKALADYLKATARQEALLELEQRERKTRAELQEQLLAQRITAAGADPQDVKAFANYYDIPFGEKAFELYSKQNSLKTDPIIDAQIKAQRKQVRWIDPGDRTSVTGLIAKLQKDPDSLSESEIDTLIAARKKTFSE
ncbi:MAG: hypothetical protein LHW48_02505 [Candidatus Cloacimonetes bacterium]|jgi:predicted metal-dependent hydrolase|nr:hypothetical protein [Candidatus Cloacimonadota bacterium]